MEREQNHLEEQAHSEGVFAVGKLYVVEHCHKAGQQTGHPRLHGT